MLSNNSRTRNDCMYQVFLRRQYISKNGQGGPFSGPVSGLIKLAPDRSPRRTERESVLGAFGGNKISVDTYRNMSDVIFERVCSCSSTVCLRLRQMTFFDLVMTFGLSFLLSSLECCFCSTSK